MLIGEVTGSKPIQRHIPPELVKWLKTELDQIIITSVKIREQYMFQIIYSLGAG